MSVVERIHERRVAPRADARCRVQVTEPGEGSEVPGDEELLAPLFGHAVNVSETGVLVEVDEPLCAGRRVIVALEHEGETFVFEGKVARTTRLRASPRYRLGIEFTRPAEEAREALRETIRSGLVTAYLN